MQHLLASGRLIGDPVRRQGAKGSFATGVIRTAGEDAILVSAIAFGSEAEQLLELSTGDAVSVSGRVRLTSWTGRDGNEKHGLSVVAEQIAAVKPRVRPRIRADLEPKGSNSPKFRSRATTPRRREVSGGPGLPDDPIGDLYA